MQPAITKPGRGADGGTRHIGVDDAAVTLTVSEIGVDQGINEPNALASSVFQHPVVRPGIQGLA